MMESKTSLVLLLLIILEYYQVKQYGFGNSEIEKTLKTQSVLFGVSSGCVSESIAQGRSYESCNIDISYCFFTRSVTYSGSGGVIYVNGGSYSMNTLNSMFCNCSCSSEGGAIYFKSVNSNLKMICANRCSATTSHFAFASGTNQNHVEYLSSCYCSYQTSGDSSLILYFGNQIIDKTNNSLNNAWQVSGICPSSGSSFTSSYCLFSNNKVSDWICIYFACATGTMSYSIIVHNDSPLRGGIVYGSGTFYMNFCVFNMNNHTLFYFKSGSVQISHSFISHSHTFSTSATISTGNNNSFTKGQTYQIEFFNFHFCNTDNPLSTPLGTIEQTPQLTPDRSYGEPSPHQSPFPEQTPHQSLFPVHTPYDTHHPVHTPYDTHYPVHTPYDTRHPDRTNQQSFPIDFIERTPSISSEQSNNNVDESKTSSAFMYSTVVLFIMILVILSYIVGTQRNPNKNHISTSSSSLDIKHKREENVKNEQENNNTTDRKRNLHNHVSSPYVF